jgi:hypothetical protein
MYAFFTDSPVVITLLGNDNNMTLFAQVWSFNVLVVGLKVLVVGLKLISVPFKLQTIVRTANNALIETTCFCALFLALFSQVATVVTGCLYGNICVYLASL